MYREPHIARLGQPAAELCEALYTQLYIDIESDAMLPLYSSAEPTAISLESYVRLSIYSSIESYVILSIYM